MNIHKNARLTPLRREEMALAVVEGHLTRAQAAQANRVAAKIVAMLDRSSRPHAMP